MKRIAAAVLVFLSCTTSRPPAVDSRAIDAAIESAIAANKIPGGVFWLERGALVYHRAYGRRAIVPRDEAMTEDTIFDAASLTKVVATTPSVWLLIERGLIGIDDPVKKFIPEFAHGDITIRHLLTHTSSLDPDPPLGQTWRGYETGVRLAIEDVPTNRPGTIFRYSDINFILLGEIVRRVGGIPLNEFASREIFTPLHMTDTGFLPSPTERIAPTEQSELGMLRGIVHDPTARRMGGVAGHAGLFTTAADLARYARMLLSGGAGVLKPETVAAMTSLQSPPNVAVRRAGGFDLDSGYARPRGTHFPIGSFGHTGWTGGFFWIDPWSKTFYIFLSNRVHPNGKGSVLELQTQLGTLAAEAAHVPPTRALPPRTPPVGWVTGAANAMNGVDVLETQRYEALRGMRIGLITNHTGFDRAGNPTIDLLRSAPGVTLVALFSPEHGIRGAVDAKVDDSIDAASGLPVYSLYGERRKPTPEQLRGLDALVFDIQDVGARFYTYISTMGLAMEAANDAHVKFIVLDRVNPIGGAVVEGPLLEGATDFVGFHPIVVRHGMTAGELARMFKEERHLDGLDLTVIGLNGWQRTMWQDDSVLPWIDTSPNMRSLRAAALYPGVGLLESAISVGRGTPTPFEVVGAPFIDGSRLARELPALPGVAVAPIRFTPDASIFKDKPCGGVRFTITDRNALRSVDLGIALAITLRRLYPVEFDATKMERLLRHPATLNAIRDGRTLDEIHELWRSDFAERRARYLLY